MSIYHCTLYSTTKYICTYIWWSIFTIKQQNKIELDNAWMSIRIKQNKNHIDTDDIDEM